ncbi:hypothetical protein ACJIZ3_006990 [Penstemon smallii]|uniref:Wax synthase domain-containing protein n=1 Tax=Penstemon smallii TaxID=265156 RepID=A0ABD3S9A1_9LAMI
MEGEMKNIPKVIVIVIVIVASLSYCHFVSARIPKGKWRLLSLAPIFYIFASLPLYLTSAIFISIITFFITWLASFKLLLFAFDKGPLSPIDYSTFKSLPTFIATAILAFKVKPKTDTPTPKKSKTILPLNLATEIPLALILIKLYDYKDHINPYIVSSAYISQVFLLGDILLSLSGLMAHAFFMVDLYRPFDEPYLSTSIQELWGRRWNLPFSNLVHHTIYKPVRPVLGRDWGILMGFLVSGLMHELALWYVTRGIPSWETTAFFVVQGVCVVVELRLKLVFGGWRLPWFVSRPLTLGLVVGTSFWLFIPPLIRNGADMKIIEEVRLVEEFVKKKIFM